MPMSIEDSKSKNILKIFTMADSTVADINKMKVVDLRKELKNRGLSAAGDKAELISRLQTAMAQSSDSNDEHGDINLDSDIDSDGVLEDDDKSHGDILEESAVDTLSEELVLSEQPSKPEVESKPLKTLLKRKITATDASKTRTETDTTGDKEPSTKKIVLNRTILASTKPTDDIAVDKTSETAVVSNKVKITVDTDDFKNLSKLELRAKRFGLPVQMSDAERKEARMKRFGQSGADSTKSNNISLTSTGSLGENLDKLKKRAERFGQTVSKIMTDIEMKEKLEKRKAKFGAA